MKKILKDFQHELRIYRLVFRDERTPRWSKRLLAIAIGYDVSPVDLVPDFIPVLGHLDDLVIVPALIWIAVKMIPRKVLEDCRNQAKLARES